MLDRSVNVVERTRFRIGSSRSGTIHQDQRIPWLNFVLTVKIKNSRIKF